MLRVASIPAIVAQHADGAAFLWVRRRAAIDSALFGEVDIGRIDQRIDANLEGLEAAGYAGWEVARSRFDDYEEPGELFTLATLAMRSGSPEAVTEAINLAERLGDAGTSGLSGAVARTDRDKLRPFAADWMKARDARRRSLALATAWHHRIDLGDSLGDMLEDEDAGVRIRALRIAGWLKRREHAPAVSAALQREDPRERFAAAVASSLIGAAQPAQATFDRLILTTPELARRAMEMRLLITPPSEAKRWLQSRLQQPVSRIDAVTLIGLLGETSIMPWLIERMREPDTALAAGEALRDLFAIDFADAGVFTSDPASLGDAFAEREDTELPSADLVEAWWKTHGPNPEQGYNSMRRLRLDAVRGAVQNADLLPPNWRRTRSHPLWL